MCLSLINLKRLSLRHRFFERRFRAVLPAASELPDDGLIFAIKKPREESIELSDQLLIDSRAIELKDSGIELGIKRFAAGFDIGADRFECLQSFCHLPEVFFLEERRGNGIRLRREGEELLPEPGILN